MKGRASHPMEGRMRGACGSYCRPTVVEACLAHADKLRYYRLAKAIRIAACDGARELLAHQGQHGWIDMIVPAGIHSEAIILPAKVRTLNASICDVSIRDH